MNVREWQRYMMFWLFAKCNRMRKIHIPWWLILSLVLLFSCSLAEGAEPDTVEALHLTWSQDPMTTQTITWQTENANENQFLEYKDVLATTSIFHKIVAAVEPFNTDEGLYYIHSVTLENLIPGHKYVYHIGADSNWNKEGSFQTESEKTNAFTFLLFGDSQSSDYNTWSKTFGQAVAQTPDTKFFINVGDLVDNGQQYVQWKGWFAAIAGYSNQIPIVPVVGNHETYTPIPENKFSLPVYFTQQFKAGQNGPEGLKGQVYSFDYGNAHFVILDSQIGEERKFLPDSLERQQAWLTKDLAATDKLWKFVFIHRPAYHNRQAESLPDPKTAAFIPIFDQYGVDVVFAGHDHVNKHTLKLKNGMAQDTGTVYMTAGRSGTKSYNTMEAKDWDDVYLDPAQPTFNVVNIDGNIFTVNVYQQDGTLIDSWNLVK